MIELPPLPHQFVRDPRHQAHEARERILMARIAELEADAARYRIIRAGNPDFPAYAMRFDPEGDDMCCGKELDDLLDAALPIFRLPLEAMAKGEKP